MIRDPGFVLLEPVIGHALTAFAAPCLIAQSSVVGVRTCFPVNVPSEESSILVHVYDFVSILATSATQGITGATLYYLLLCISS